MAVKWEYFVTIIHADCKKEGVEDFINSKFPNWKHGRFVPEALIPSLDRQGALGWELIEILPIWQNDDGTIEPPSDFRITNKYLCTFKRIKED